MILRMLYAIRPGGVSETIVLRVLQDLDFECELNDVRQEMDYLRSLGLAEASQDVPTGWWSRLTAQGVAVVEYDTPAPSGIGRTKRPRGSR
jgi:hypothetical protein